MKKISIWIIAYMISMTSCHHQSSEYDATGTFEATEIIISAETSGKLIFFNAEEGKL